jgi:hypothetical protein
MENRISRTVIITICILVILFFVVFIIGQLQEIKNESEIAKTTSEEETTKESTPEKPGISEKSEQVLQEETKNETDEETIKENEGIMTNAYPLFEHQGIVLDIDYEKYIMTIENAKTGDIEELDCYRIIEKYGGDKSALDVSYHFINPPINPLTGGFKLLEDANFKDIKIGYYVAIYTTKDAGKKEIEFYQDDNLITVIYFSEERWW